MNQTQKYYLEQLIQLAKEYQISITFIETPKYEIVASDCNYLSAMDTYIRLAKDKNVPCIISEHTAKCLNNYTCETYVFDHTEPKYFLDAINLSYEGRVSFTRLLLSLRV